MKNLSDDILNRYIDNELNSEELENVREILEINSDELEKLKAHSLVDRTLRRLSIYFAPEDITRKVMEKIFSITSTVKIKGAKFFISIISFFTAIILGILIYGLATLPPIEPTSDDNFFTQVINDLVNKFDFFNAIFKNETFLLFGSIFILIVLISIYFLKDAHKSFMKKIDNYAKNPT